MDAFTDLAVLASVNLCIVDLANEYAQLAHFGQYLGYLLSGLSYLSANFWPKGTRMVKNNGKKYVSRAAKKD